MLAQRAAEGEARAEKQLAQRLIVRVRRAAHALMGGASEADDAAQHALIELLRSMRGYPGETSLESWADRLAVRSLVRFARAVRSRKASSAGEPARYDGRPEQFARTLEEFLRELPSAPREALLLREAFGFDLIETAQLVRSSTRSTREQLARARHSLYLRSTKVGDLPSEELPADIERWFSLRDRAETGSAPRTAEALQGAGNDELSPVEQDELRTLEAQPELRRLQKELRALSQFIEGGRFGRLSQRDKKLLEGALAAARVSSISASQALPREAARETVAEVADTSWVHPVSLSMCVVLVVGAFVALALRAPEAALHGAPAPLPRADEAHAPTVEALSSAQVGERGARLSRDGKPLEQGMSLREGDVVAADGRAGCFGLSPRADVCLAAGSRVRIAQLSLKARRVELMTGRVVASVERVEPGVPLTLSVRELRVEGTDAVLGFELDGDELVVRVLRGPVLVETPTGTQALASAQSAIYRAPGGQLEVVPQLVEKARRDWDLLATRALRPAAERAAPSVKPGAAASTASAVEPRAEDVALVDAAPVVAAPDLAPEPESEPVAVLAVPGTAAPEQSADEPPEAEATADASTPEEQLANAKEAVHGRRFAQGAAIYQDLIQTAPGSRSAREALVLRAELLSERLRMPAEAITLFDRYLGSGGGLLEVRARYGRILALRHLNRAAEERAATQEFLFSHGTSPQARILRARMAAASDP